MDVKDIKLGTKLELVVYDYNGMEIKPTYVSQLEEVLDSGDIVIAAPIHEGKIIYLSVGSKIKINFFDSKRLFSFMGEVTARAKRENIVMLKIAVRSKLTRIQRREYFRFEWALPVKLRVLGPAGAENKITANPFVDALTKDISGGGLGLLTNEHYQINDIVELELDLEGKKICTYGKVVRSVIYEHDNKKYDTGIIFKEIKMRDRDAIIKFIFDKQIKLMQKGML
ncbi:MAG: hypothetical protein PWR27_28 [Petroclostridium sp.]|nr:hypothetical protein [Clostridia bacterium]MDK2809319.1 hypothetical protein [Petroclostridium sp.]